MVYVFIFNGFGNNVTMMMIEGLKTTNLNTYSWWRDIVNAASQREST